MLLHYCYMLYFLHPVSNSTSAQEECTITPLNPINTLTATGGTLASGTENVMIQCSCTIYNDDVVRWYDPGGSKLFLNESKNFIPDAPHFTRVNGPTDNRNIILVIPTFNDTYDGIYTCGRRISNTEFGAPNVSVIFTVTGELMIHILS